MREKEEKVRLSRSSTISGCQFQTIATLYPHRPDHPSEPRVAPRTSSRKRERKMERCCPGFENRNANYGISPTRTISTSFFFSRAKCRRLFRRPKCIYIGRYRVICQPSIMCVVLRNPGRQPSSEHVVETDGRPAFIWLNATNAFFIPEALRLGSAGAFAMSQRRAWYARQAT
jgi:hypothetical protein